jgi:hypothetical protein
MFFDLHIMMPFVRPPPPLLGDKLVRTVMAKVAWDGGIRNLLEGRQSHFPR